jgi:hypothetical protein
VNAGTAAALADMRGLDLEIVEPRELLQELAKEVRGNGTAPR